MVCPLLLLHAAPPVQHPVPTKPGERARPIDGWPGYWVTDRGRIWSTKTRRFLRPGVTQGYRHVTLSRGGRRQTFRVHALVAAAFLGPRPPGMEINHRDGDKANNAVGNLEYLARSANLRHAYRTGLLRKDREHNPRAKLTSNQVGEIRALYARGGLTQVELARRFGVSRPTISDIVRCRSWRDQPPPPPASTHAPSKQRPAA